MAAKHFAELDATPPGGTLVDGTAPYSTGAAFDEWRVAQTKNSVVPVVVKDYWTGGPTGLMLHAAIDTFVSYCRKNLVAAPAAGEEEQVSAWGGTFSKEVERLKRCHDDIPLPEFGWNSIDAAASYWAKRPPNKRTGLPISVKTVKNQLKALRRFIKWASRNYGWTPPLYWEDATKKRAKLTDEEKNARKSPERVKTYTEDQLAVLYKYATPWERLLMMAAICGGYGAAELTTLAIDDLHLNPNGHSYIKRIRGKEVTYGEHWVCPELRIALEWALDRRKAMTTASTGKDITWKPSSKLILRESGEPLCKVTPAGNTSNKAANTWTGKLFERVKKDHPDFPKLSFGKLRKTASNWVRRYGGGEMARLFTMHGSTVENDDNLAAYTNEDFRKLFKVQRKVHRRKLRAIFAQVTEPFPAGERKKGGDNISLGTIDKIRSLWAACEHPEAIAEKCGVGRATVYRHRLVPPRATA